MASPSNYYESDMESDVYSTASALFSDQSFSSQTSYSVRSPSPVPSVMSVTSSLREQATILEYGRGVNSQSDVYRLPADDLEVERLRKQHLMLREVMGKYPPVLAEVLADDTPGETKACIDLGCGSGDWIIEVANDFPNCSAVAVDLVPLQNTAMPANCRSEVDDVNLGLEHHYGSFDVVHSRLISSGIKDFRSYIDQISLVLRPGGLIDLAEFDFYSAGADKQRLVVDTSRIGFPWYPCWAAFLRMAIEARGGCTNVASNLNQWVSEHGAFEDVVCTEYWIPPSPWIQGDDQESVRQRWIGENAREDISALLKSGRPLLRGYGLPEALVLELEENAALELKEAKVPYWGRMVQVYARKKPI